MTVHAPRTGRITTWCDTADPDTTISTDPDAVDCELCIAEMHATLEQLRQATPRLRHPGPRLVPVERLAELLPELGPDDDGLAVVAAIRERLREGERSARRVRVLEDREASVIEILTGRMEPRT